MWQVFLAYRRGTCLSILHTLSLPLNRQFLFSSFSSLDRFASSVATIEPVSHLIVELVRFICCCFVRSMFLWDGKLA